KRRPRPSKRSVNALASPASCKGVLSALEAAMALAAGMRDAGLEAEELPVAAGGEGTAGVVAAGPGGEGRGGGGGRLPLRTRSVALWRRGISSWTTGRLWSRRRRRSGYGGSGRTN